MFSITLSIAVIVLLCLGTRKAYRAARNYRKAA